MRTCRWLINRTRTETTLDRWTVHPIQHLNLTCCPRWNHWRKILETSWASVSHLTTSIWWSLQRRHALNQPIPRLLQWLAKSMTLSSSLSHACWAHKLTTYTRLMSICVSQPGLKNNRKNRTAPTVFPNLDAPVKEPLNRVLRERPPVKQLRKEWPLRLSSNLRSSRLRSLD